MAKPARKRPASISAIVRASRPVLAKVRRKQAKVINPMFVALAKKWYGTSCEEGDTIFLKGIGKP